MRTTSQTASRSRVTVFAALLATFLLSSFAASSAGAAPAPAEARTAWLVLIPSGSEDGFDENLFRAFERTPGLSPAL